ncbi:MAG: hypothetical protein HC902_08910 [Calothrix sp. SM1_5_4]|nr:hypothetical protein [Calothrix sp. SM1_5_4]
MKSVTEFWVHTLNKGLKAKEELTAAGKTPEEIQQSLGETFKYEGDKLKHFVAAIDVAGQNLEKLSRVLVVSLNEGETAPPKSVKIEEYHYVPDFQVAPRAVNTQKADPKAPRAVAVVVEVVVDRTRRSRLPGV